jgi:ATP-dependent Clp protease ATP-binding subunit ClpA
MPGSVRFNARSALERAREEAVRHGSARIGTEHLLIAAVAEATGGLRQVLEGAGASPDRLREATAELERRALRSVGIEIDMPPRVVATPRRTPLGDGAKDAFHSMVRSATTGAGRTIELEHLLVAICRGSDRDPAIVLLRSIGIDPSWLAALVMPTEPRIA